MSLGRYRDLANFKRPTPKAPSASAAAAIKIAGLKPPGPACEPSPVRGGKGASAASAVRCATDVCVSNAAFIVCCAATVAWAFCVC
jgi:hypothetical protein